MNYRAFADITWLACLSRCSSWPKLSLYYTKIDYIMYAEKTLLSWYYCRPSVRPSVCLSVLCNVVHCGTQGRRRRLKVVQPSYVFLGEHFLFTSSGCVVRGKRNHRKFRSWNSHGQHCIGGSVLQLYRTSYAVRSAFLATATLPVLFHPMLIVHIIIDFEAA